MNRRVVTSGHTLSDHGLFEPGWLLIPCGFDDVEDHVDDQFWV